MQITDDALADAIYIRLRQGNVDDTLNMGKYIHVDVDKEGMPLGLEVLFPKYTRGYAQEERKKDACYYHSSTIIAQ